MLALRKSEIPEYLKQGELYRTLLENNDDLNEEVTFPVEVLKPNIQVDSLTDCDHLLNSLRFWGVDNCVFKEIISYVLKCHETLKSIDALLQKYETEFKFVHWLRQVIVARPCDRSRVAIQSGLIELVELVFVSMHSGKKTDFLVDACNWAAEVGNLEVMKFLHKNGCQINCKTVQVAVSHGHTSLLQWLVQNGVKVSSRELISAVRSGHLECVQIICAVIILTISAMVHSCDTAAVHGQLTILQYFHSKGFYWGNYTTISAAMGGHLHCLHYLHEHGCPWNSNICAVTAERGHLECLQYAHQHGCPINNSVADAAVAGNHLHCLKYLHEQGCEWSILTCRRAARSGHLDCLQYAHQHGAPFNNLVADAAVEGNHLHCLKYAHEHGCAWTYEQSGGTERVCFVVFAAIERTRLPHDSPLVWEYLRMHATNA